MSKASQHEAKSGTIPWTVDFPSLYRQLIEDPTALERIGAGFAYGLALTLMQLENIRVIASKKGDQDILECLTLLGITPGAMSKQNKLASAYVKSRKRKGSAT